MDDTQLDTDQNYAEMERLSVSWLQEAEVDTKLKYCQGQHPGDPIARPLQGCHVDVLSPEPSAQTTPAPALLKGHLAPRWRWQLSTCFLLPTYL